MSLFMGLLALVLVIALMFVLYRVIKSATGFIINAVVGVILLWLINFLSLMSLAGRPDIPINLITVLICAIGGVFGVLVTVVLHLLGIPLTL
ncbi:MULTISPECIES: pro-sigmaK processing inhibitor BofA family protein [unclassified Methanoculleus]|jgi:pro-sigmaK processing inhibitor BofA|uniref:Pro-sigmaK processing inhibitor BofA family protein n=1 Tax=Methanoculleus palmolei TaxID=72612 RepID=A0ABD8AB34_9EURY|nr:pro-sigmaK processing inhibitor BofA family protein [Methanoculleus sp. UBA377]WOX56345.1 pro-sigmaK processing inhibitor BofA family protein [Methanoculleus palmolei]